MKNWKGTKGEWGVYYQRIVGDPSMRPQEINIMLDGRGSQNIAKCWNSRDIGRNGSLTIEEARSNAKLISKAPLLLEYLLEAIKEVYLETNNIPKAWIEVVKEIQPDLLDELDI